MGPKVARDFRCSVSLDQLAEPKNKPKREQSRENWRKRALRFLRRGNLANDREQDEGQPARKRHRTKSFEWLLAVHNALATSVGRGLDAFHIPVDTKTSAWSWPALSIAADQGPDGMRAMNACQFGPLRVNVDRVDDPSHGCHNDIVASIRSCGLYPHSLLMSVARNSIHGPFNEGRRFIETAEAVAEYTKLTNPHSCPIFQVLLPSMLEDLNWVEKAMEPDILEQVWNEFRSSTIFTKKGCKESSSRFCTHVTRAKAEDCTWTFRYLGFLIVCLQTGEYSETRLAQALKSSMQAAAKAATHCTGGDMPPTRQGAEVVANMRSVTRNQLEVATLMFGDFDNRCRQRVIYLGAGPCQRWHSQQNKRNRACSESIAWEIEQLRGGY